MAESEIKLKVTAEGADEAADQLDNLNQALQQNTEALEENTNATNNQTEASGGFLESMESMATGFNSALEVGKKWFDGLQTIATEYNRQSGIINGFTGTISESSNRINGLISNLNLMQASSRLAATGLQLADHDLANIAVAAQQYSQRTGADLNESFNQLTEALNSGSSEALHRFGIETGGATDKVEGQMNAIRSLDEQYGNIESDATGVAAMMTRLKVATENATTAFIEQISGSEELQGSLSELGNEFSGLLQDMGLVDGEFDIIQTAADSFKIVVIALSDKIRFMVQALREFAQGHYETAFTRLTQAMNDVGLVQGAANRVSNENRQRQQQNQQRENQAPTQSTVTTPTPRRSGGGGGGSRTDELQAFWDRENAQAHQRVEDLRNEFALSDQFNNAQELAEQQRLDLYHQQTDAIKDRIDAEQFAAEQAQIQADKEIQNQKDLAETERQRNSVQESMNKHVEQFNNFQSLGVQLAQTGAAHGKKAVKEQLKEWLKSFAIKQSLDGGKELAEGIALSTNPLTAAQASGHYISAAKHFALAAAAGGGAAGLAAGGAGSGGGAGSKETGDKPSSKPTGVGSSDSSNTSGNVIINIQGQTYLTQAQVGGAIKDALQAHTARYGS